MESNETKQSEQGQVSAPGESPKDSESDFQEQRFQNCLAEIQKIVSSYPVEWRPKVLAGALEQATKRKDAAEKIVEIGQEIRRTCDSLLDSKAKATIALLSELSSLSGISNVGVDFATDILHSAFGQKDVKQAFEQFPDDNDVAFLSYVFGLAHSVTGAGEETPIEQPQVDEPEDAEAGPNTGIKALDNCVERLSLEATVASYCVMRLMCVSDKTGKKIIDYLRKEVAIFDDPESLEKQTAMDSQIQSECSWFLGFVRGAEVGYQKA